MRATHVRHFLWVLAVKELVQHMHRSLGLDGHACPHPLGVDVSDHFFGVRLLVAVRLWCLCSCGSNSGLVVEAIEITSGVAECLHPLLWL